ncbi:Isoform b [Mycena sanguinolenta]|uniref:Isoform b n=1 Tax=Mycena sanguinolenta TaxID=230812 RepID=A0A8H6YZY8_9AGAR|nr:Isoform b [Mycena sanguinolenta]
MSRSDFRSFRSSRRSRSSSSGKSNHSSTPSTGSLPDLYPQPNERSDLSPRPNEHLAVLLPKHLWKPDSAALNCDNFYCSTSFSLFERRHHCRKCGGVFCGPCSTRSTSLLDASALPFLHPPRGTPLAAFESPDSPIVTARVCDDCYDRIHGIRSPTRRAAPLSRANSLPAGGTSLSRAGSRFRTRQSSPLPLRAPPPLPAEEQTANFTRTH